ncbi:MAG: ATP-binding protein, partial [Clostridiales bacterium]
KKNDIRKYTPDWIRVLAISYIFFITIITILFYSWLKAVKLRKTEAKRANIFLSALEQSGEIVFITNENGLIKFVNNTFEKVTGISKEEAINQKTSILKSGKMEKKYYELLWNKLLKGEIFKDIVINKKKNGEIFYYDQTITPIIENYENTVLYISMGKDITDRIKINEELVKYKNELEKLVYIRTKELEELNSKLVLSKTKAELTNIAKDEFIVHMSHEIRTPLNAILGFSQILSIDKSIEPEAKNKINIIRNNGKHLVDIMNEIHDLSKIESGEQELKEKDFNFKKFIDDIKNIFYISIMEKGLVLSFSPEMMFPEYVMGDKKKLFQIFINIIGNSIKFTDKGEIKVKFKFEKIKNDLNIYTQIIDNGIGIPKNELETIFDSFKQGSNNNIGGTGLGLTITRDFIKLMNGYIEVKSKLGNGTEFNFMVRLKCSAGTKVSIIKDDLNIKKHLDIDIFILDSDKYNLVYLETILKDRGFNVYLLETLEKLEENLKNIVPNLLLINIDMDSIKKENNFESYKSNKKNILNDEILRLEELIREIKKEQKNLFVIGITSNVYCKCNFTFVNHLLFKPIEAEILFQIIENKYGLENKCDLKEKREEKVDVMKMLLDEDNDSIEKFLKNIKPQWEAVCKNRSFDNLTIFMHRIIETSKELKIEYMKIYGEELLNDIKKFNITNIENTIIKFNDIYKKEEEFSNDKCQLEKF